MSVTGGGGANLTLSPPTLSVPATGTTGLTVSLNAEGGVAWGLYTGDVVFTCTVAGVTTVLNAQYLYVVGGSNGFLQGNMNSANPPGDGTAPDEFASPGGYAAGTWTE